MCVLEAPYHIEAEEVYARQVPGHLVVGSVFVDHPARVAAKFFGVLHARRASALQVEAGARLIRERLLRATLEA
eukprot:1539111-Pyramimonas_sp.AAC.1